MAQKFFSLVPTGTNIQFVKNRWRYITMSIIAVLISLGALAWNSQSTGSILNFGIDFAGGSQVRLAFAADKDPGVQAVRDALEDLGYQGSGAVTVPDAEHEVLVRVKETLSISEEEIDVCRGAAQSVAAAKEGEAAAGLIALNHPSGGSKLFLTYDAEPDYQAVEQVVNDAGCEGTADKGFGAKEGEFAVEFALIGIGAKIREEMDDTFGADTVTEIVLSETVGAKVGGQLKEDGAKSMLYAIGFIFLFVMIRFDLRFAPGGIVALTHDALLVIGAFAIFGKEFNLQTIAAILTVIGYSINDTIVVFDRVRERVALHRDEPIEATTNTALNETLSRTILTSGTTLIVVLATYFMGSGPIKDFAFALIVGVLVGTYSSLFIATPVFLWVNRKFYEGKGHLRWLDDSEKEGTGTLLGVGQKKKPGDEDEGEGEGADEEEAEAAADPGRRKVARRRRRRRPDAEDEQKALPEAEAEPEAKASGAEADPEPKKASKRRRRRRPKDEEVEAKQPEPESEADEEPDAKTPEPEAKTPEPEPVAKKPESKPKVEPPKVEAPKAEKKDPLAPPDIDDLFKFDDDDKKDE